MLDVLLVLQVQTITNVSLVKTQIISKLMENVCLNVKPTYLQMEPMVMESTLDYLMIYHLSMYHLMVILLYKIIFQPLLVMLSYL